MSDLIVEHRGAVAELWLNRPNVLNALSGSLQEQVISAFAELEADLEIGVVILAGQGRAFTAGSDRKEIAKLPGSPPQQVLESFARGERLVRTILDSRLTVILAAHGYCVGGGVSIALASDVCLAAEATQFFIPELDLDMAYLWQSTPLLAASVGISRARALIVTGDRFDAEQAHGMGLVHAVSSPERLFDDARELAKRLAEKPRTALEAQKRLARRAIDRFLADAEEEFALLVAASDGDGRADVANSN
ncbi:MAG: enoyl-CoA hydratase/isomerase family protein [Mesorhizobium sp.]|nr:enoyl-CoA hydratase/isomerase family protein [Mesorhizobium sp.]MCO5164593.1 enoyl-CoA hydratase/isomerase family protein [Mesorhizobium sp.]